MTLFGFLKASSLLCLTTWWATSTSKVAADNNYPVVFVHGFTGWGPDEMLGFPYWGELQGDLPKQLTERGFKVIVASVGPYASNWDRVCELYCRIKGCTVDYGQKHSKTHGHRRYGRTYEGLYPEWGTLDENGNVRKIHLIGHSMGGQTIRMLAQLLAQGSEGAPVEEDPWTSSELFQGGKGDWIQSITAVASPNQGTFVVDALNGVASHLEKLAGVLFAMIGLQGDQKKLLFDAKLDQWGLGPKKSNESLKQYLKRVFASKMFQPGFKDISLYSMTSAGAAEENKWVKVLPNIHYFSICTRDSYAAKNFWGQNIQLPHLSTMLVVLDPMSLLIGSRFGPDRGYPESWQINDGVVSTESQMGDGIAPAVSFDGVPEFGKWMVKLFDRMDHEAIVGLNLHTKVLPIYVDHLTLLRSLSSEGNGDMDMLESVEEPVALDYFNQNSHPMDDKDMETLCAEAREWSTYSRAFCEHMVQHGINGTLTL